MATILRIELSDRARSRIAGIGKSRFAVLLPFRVRSLENLAGNESFASDFKLIAERLFRTQF